MRRLGRLSCVREWRAHAAALLDANHDGKLTVDDFRRADCRVSPWRPWGRCVAVCSGEGLSKGRKARRRHITRQPTHGGHRCPTLIESTSCLHPCVLPTPVPTVTRAPTRAPTSAPTVAPSHASLSHGLALLSMCFFAAALAWATRDYHIIIEKRTNLARQFWYSPLDGDKDGSEAHGRANQRGSEGPGAAMRAQHGAPEDVAACA